MTFNPQPKGSHIPGVQRTMTEEEEKMMKKYGKLPSRHDLCERRMSKDRRYFDSGDYVLSKVGAASPDSVGTQLPSPEHIPHTRRDSMTPSVGMNMHENKSIEL